jgi:hypothetical protein
MMVLVQWAWNYFTRRRGARLITGKDPAVREVHKVSEGMLLYQRGPQEHVLNEPNP